MGSNIPIPAQTARTLATSVRSAIEEERSLDRKANARRLERAASEALASLERKDGEYVSLNATNVATLTAFSDYDEETVRAKEAARVYLEQYGIWG